MRLTRFKRNTQGFARPKQMLLADHFIQSLRPQALGQWNCTHA
jgi:hypothetical protein